MSNVTFISIFSIFIPKTAPMLGSAPWKFLLVANGRVVLLFVCWFLVCVVILLSVEVGVGVLAAGVVQLHFVTKCESKSYVAGLEYHVYNLLARDTDLTLTHFLHFVSTQTSTVLTWNNQQLLVTCTIHTHFTLSTYYNIIKIIHLSILIIDCKPFNWLLEAIRFR